MAHIMSSFCDEQALSFIDIESLLSICFLRTPLLLLPLNTGLSKVEEILTIYKFQFDLNMFV